MVFVLAVLEVLGVLLISLGSIHRPAPSGVARLRLFQRDPQLAQLVLGLPAAGPVFLLVRRPPSEPEIGDPQLLLVGFQRHEPQHHEAMGLAQSQADAWLPGAMLLNASMQVDWPWTVPSLKM